MTTMNNEDPADPSVHERQDAYRCIAPACKPLGCSMCNCAVPADVYAALLTPLHGEIERLRDVAREAADAATKHQAEVLRLRAEVKALREALDEAATDCELHPLYLGDSATLDDIIRTGGDAAFITGLARGLREACGSAAEKEQPK